MLPAMIRRLQPKGYPEKEAERHVQEKALVKQLAKSMVKAQAKGPNGRDPPGYS